MPQYLDPSRFEPFDPDPEAIRRGIRNRPQHEKANKGWMFSDWFGIQEGAWQKEKTLEEINKETNEFFKPVIDKVEKYRLRHESGEELSAAEMADWQKSSRKIQAMNDMVKKRNATLGPLGTKQFLGGKTVQGVKMKAGVGFDVNPHRLHMRALNVVRAFPGVGALMSEAERRSGIETGEVGYSEGLEGWYEKTTELAASFAGMIATGKFALEPGKKLFQYGAGKVGATRLGGAIGRLAGDKAKKVAMAMGAEATGFLAYTASVDPYHAFDPAHAGQTLVEGSLFGIAGPLRGLKVKDVSVGRATSAAFLGVMGYGLEQRRHIIENKLNPFDPKSWEPTMDSLTNATAMLALSLSSTRSNDKRTVQQIADTLRSPGVRPGLTPKEAKKIARGFIDNPEKVDKLLNDHSMIANQARRFIAMMQTSQGKERMADMGYDVKDVDRVVDTMKSTFKFTDSELGLIRNEIGKHNKHVEQMQFNMERMQGIGDSIRMAREEMSKLEVGSEEFEAGERMIQGLEAEAAELRKLVNVEQTRHMDNALIAESRMKQAEMRMEIDRIDRERLELDKESETYDRDVEDLNKRVKEIEEQLLAEEKYQNDIAGEAKPVDKSETRGDTIDALKAERESLLKPTEGGEVSKELDSLNRQRVILKSAADKLASSLRKRPNKAKAKELLGINEAIKEIDAKLKDAAATGVDAETRANRIKEINEELRIMGERRVESRRTKEVDVETDKREVKEDRRKSRGEAEDPNYVPTQDMTPEQIRKLAIIDPMTGLKSYRAWLDGKSLPVEGIMDVNNGKSSNDNLSHNYFDTVIKGLGEIIKKHFPDNGITEACRRSGDEFLFGGHDEADVVRRLNAVREEFSKTKFKFVDASTGKEYEIDGYTVSWGVKKAGTTEEIAMQSMKDQDLAAGVRVGRDEVAPNIKDVVDQIKLDRAEQEVKDVADQQTEVSNPEATPDSVNRTVAETIAPNLSRNAKNPMTKERFAELWGEMLGGDKRANQAGRLISEIYNGVAKMHGKTYAEFLAETVADLLPRSSQEALTAQALFSLTTGEVKRARELGYVSESSDRVLSTLKSWNVVDTNGTKLLKDLGFGSTLNAATLEQVLTNGIAARDVGGFLAKAEARISRRVADIKIERDDIARIKREIKNTKDPDLKRQKRQQIEEISKKVEEWEKTNVKDAQEAKRLEAGWEGVLRASKPILAEIEQAKARKKELGLETKAQREAYDNKYIKPLREKLSDIGYKQKPKFFVKPTSTQKQVDAMQVEIDRAISDFKESILKAQRDTGYKMFDKDWKFIEKHPMEAATTPEGYAVYPGFQTTMENRVWENIDKHMGEGVKERFRHDIIKTVEEEYQTNKSGLFRTLKKIATGDKLSRLKSALKSADKTYAALNVTTSCPMFNMGNMGCYYNRCYGVGMAKMGQAAPFFSETPYLGEILQMSPHEIKVLNRAGGLRFNGMGDTVDFVAPQWRDALRHAAMRGLKTKVITKQPSTLKVLAELANPNSELYKGYTQKQIDATVKAAKDTLIQPTVDPYWIPTDRKFLHGGSLLSPDGKLGKVYDRAKRAYAKTGDDALLKEVADKYAEMSGRAVRVKDGEVWVKDGFSSDQLGDMVNNPDYQDLKILPRAVLMTAKEIVEFARVAPEVLQTWMHSPVRKEMFSDVHGRTLTKEEMLDFSTNVHIDVKKQTMSAWNLKTGKPVKNKNIAEVDRYIKENVEPHEQAEVYKTLKRMVCCQVNPKGVKQLKDRLKLQDEKDYFDECLTCNAACGHNRTVGMSDLSKMVDRAQRYERSGQKDGVLFSSEVGPEGEIIRRMAMDINENGLAIFHGLDAPTFRDAIHDLGHAIRRFLPEEMRVVAEEHFGVKDGDWTEVVKKVGKGKDVVELTKEEVFADAFVEYLRTGHNRGRKLTKAMRNVFEKVRGFFADLYENLISKGDKNNLKDRYGITLSPGMIDFFDAVVGARGSKYTKAALKKARARLRELKTDAEQKRLEISKKEWARALNVDESATKLVRPKDDLRIPEGVPNRGRIKRMTAQNIGYLEEFSAWVEGGRKGPEPEAPEGFKHHEYKDAIAFEIDAERAAVEARKAEEAVEARRKELDETQPRTVTQVHYSGGGKTPGIKVLREKLQNIKKGGDPDAEIRLAKGTKPGDPPLWTIKSRLSKEKIAELLGENMDATDQQVLTMRDEADPYLMSTGEKSVNESVTTEPVEGDVRSSVEAAKEGVHHATVQSNRNRFFDIKIDPLEGKPKPRNAIVFNIAKALGKKIFSGTKYSKVRVAANDPLGEYHTATGELRTRYYGDLQATGHEVGHYLDDFYGLSKYKGHDRELTYDRELVPQFAGWAKAVKDINIRRLEAMGEWLRAWLANPNEAEYAAPEFTKRFKELVDPSVQKALRQFGDEIRIRDGANAMDIGRAKYEGYSRVSGMWNHIASMFGKTPDDIGATLPLWTKWAANRWKPWEYAAEELYRERAIRGLEGPLPAEDARLLARLFSGRDDMILQVFKHGIFDPNKPRDPNNKKGWLVDFGVEEMFSKLDQTTSERFMNDYHNAVSMGLAERIIELKGREEFQNRDPVGVWDKPGGDLAWAHEVLMEIKKMSPEKQDAYRHVNQKMRQWGEGLLRYAQARGRMSKKEVDRIMRDNTYWTPLNRVMDLAGSDMHLWDGKGSGVINQKIYHRIKGSRREVKDMFQSLLEATQRIITESDRANFTREFFDASVMDGRKIHEGPVPTGSEWVRKAKESEQHGQKVDVWRDGKKEEWIINNRSVYDAYKDLQKGGMHLPAVISIVPRILRQMVVHSPDFIVRNYIRDTARRGIISKRHFTLMPDVPTKAKIAEFELYGGGQGKHYMYSQQKWDNEARRRIKEMVRDKKNVVVSSMGGVRWFAKNYHKLAMLSEVAGRLPEYREQKRYAKEKLGYNEMNASLYAAYEARNLLDFAIAGNISQYLSAMNPFTNASIQGFKRDMVAFMERPTVANKMAFSAKWLAMVMIPEAGAAYLAAQTGRLDDYLDLPWWRKLLFWNYVIPSEKGDMWLAVPKPFELGAIATGAWQATMKALGYDETAMEGVPAAILDNATPIGWESVVPMVGRIPFELTADHEGFYNRPIVGYERTRPGSDRPIEDERGTQVAKWLQVPINAGMEGAFKAGKALGITDRHKPVYVDQRQIDYVIRNVTGNIGVNVSRGIDKAVGRDKKNRFSGLALTGLFKESAGPSSRSVKWIDEYYKSKGERGIPKNSYLAKLIDRYWEADRAGRSELSRQIVKEAKRVREMLEKKGE